MLKHIRRIDPVAVIAFIAIYAGLISATQVILEAVTIYQQHQENLTSGMKGTIHDERRNESCLCMCVHRPSV